MANYKPLLAKVNTFDAAAGTTFSFSWKGAQAFYNELIIRDSRTLAVVYQHKIKTMALRHVMDVSAGAAGSFINGQQYQAAVTVYNKENIACGTSDPVSFWCYSSPVLEVSNSDLLSGVITMSSFYLNLNYRQTEGELLKEYTVSIYDVGRNLLNQSPVFTVTASDEPLSYKVEGLTNQTTYYIKADGVTRHGISVSTGHLPFAVKYDRMGVGSVLTARNIGDGTISISSNFRITNASSYPEQPTYIDGKEIDLTARDSCVRFHGGIDIGQDFELKAHLRNLREGGSLTLKGRDASITIRYESFYPDPAMTVKKQFFRLTAAGAASCHAMTKLFDAPGPNVYLDLLVTSQNGYYSIDLHINESS